MTTALRISGLAVLGAVIALILKRTDRTFAGIAVIGSGILLLLCVSQPLIQSISALWQLSNQAQLGSETTQNLARMLGIALLTELSAQLCRDAGEEGLAQKASLAGKWLLLSMTAPMLLELGQMILTLIP